MFSKKPFTSSHRLSAELELQTDQGPAGVHPRSPAGSKHSKAAQHEKIVRMVLWIVSVSLQTHNVLHRVTNWENYPLTKNIFDTALSQGASHKDKSYQPAYAEAKSVFKQEVELIRVICCLPHWVDWILRVVGSWRNRKFTIISKFAWRTRRSARRSPFPHASLFVPLFAVR